MDKEKSIRQEFADTMLEVGKNDSRLIVLVGDISHFILQPFAKTCPRKFYNIGICEPTIVNMSAGLSKLGFIPIIHTFSPFLIERAFEQIKLDFGYQKLGCNLISVGSAFDNGALGCSHHCYDDFALLKNVEGMQIIYPASCKEFNLLFKQTYDNGYPTYFRIPEKSHGINFKDEEIIFGEGILVQKGKDITIIVIGPQLKTVLDSIEPLAKLGISVEIIYLHTIKPYDSKIVNNSLLKTKKCLIIEEHSMYGGLFEDVLRSAKDLDGVKYAGINLRDKYVRDYGKYEDHCNRIGFSVEGIIQKIKEELITPEN